MNNQPGGQRWQRVETLFHEALERPALERKSYLQNRCGSDRTLIEEVLSLLESFESSAEFLEGFGESESELLAGVLNELDGSLAESTLSGTPVEDSAQSDLSTLRSKSTISREQGTHDQLTQFDLSDFKSNFSKLRPEIEILQQVGRGGTGLVLKARDHRLNRDLAIKVLHHDSRVESGGTGANVSAALEREGRAAAAVSSDFTVRVYEIGSLDQNQTYLILEWISGPSLRDVLSSYDYLPPQESATIARQVALGLGTAHRIGLIHGDVKPGNILLESMGDSMDCISNQNHDWTLPDELKYFRAKVTDFGLARICSAADSASPGRVRFAGTPAYASPECLIDRQPGDSRSDVWSAGVTLYRMLTGISPYRGAPHAIVRQMRETTPTAPRKLDPSIPRDLDSICLKAMSIDPDNRYRDGFGLAADLQRFLDGEPTVARPISAWQKTWRWVVRNPRHALTAIALALTILILFVGALVSSAIFSRQNRQLIDNKRAADFARLQRIIVASPALLPSLLDFEDLNINLAIPYLREIVADSQRELQPRWNAAVALAELGEPQTTLLIEAVTTASPQPEQCQNLIRGLRNDRNAATEKLRTLFAKTTASETRARIAIVAAHLGEREPLETVSHEHEQPETRTTLIHLLPSFHGQLDAMLAFLNDDYSDDVHYVICMALNLFHVNEFSSNDRESVRAALKRLLHSSGDSGANSAARLALAHWGGDLRAIPVDRFSDNWREFEPGVRLVRVPASSNVLGRTNPGIIFNDHLPHAVTLTQAFWIADREVSVGQFQQFLDDPNYPLEWKPSLQHRRAPDSATSPTAAHPVQRVSWNDAVLFCNWLSWRHGKQPRYKLVAVNDADDENSRQGSAVKYSVEWWVTIDRDANGFRLPSEAQWEIACRAGSKTDFFFGDDFDLFRHYGTFSSARIAATAPCGSLLPNRLGLHEMLGSVWEWSETWYAPIGAESVVDPEGPEHPDPERLGRTFLGGGVQTRSGEPTSGSRGFAHPDSRFGNVGFRVSLPDWE